MTEPDGHPLRKPPVAGDEITTLLGSLKRQRATFVWNARGSTPPASERP